MSSKRRTKLEQIVEIISDASTDFQTKFQKLKQAEIRWKAKQTELKKAIEALEKEKKEIDEALAASEKFQSDVNAIINERLGVANVRVEPAFAATPTTPKQQNTTSAQ